MDKIKKIYSIPISQVLAVSTTVFHLHIFRLAAIYNFSVSRWKGITTSPHNGHLNNHPSIHPGDTTAELKKFSWL